MRESAIEQAVCRHARQRGWLADKFTSPGRRAAPDRILLKEGRTFFIEFKAPGKKPTQLQEQAHRRLLTAGFEVFVVDDIDTGKRLIDALS